MRPPEGTELLLLLRIQLILDPNEECEVHLLHTLLEGRHLLELREHRRLVHVVGGEQLAERLGFRVEPPLEAARCPRSIPFPRATVSRMPPRSSSSRASKLGVCEAKSAASVSCAAWAIAAFMEVPRDAGGRPA